MDANPKQIPNFITARSPQGLRRQMLKNNARLVAFVRYFDIQQTPINGSVVWIAWFYEDINENDFAPKLPSEVLNGSAE